MAFTAIYDISMGRLIFEWTTSILSVLYDIAYSTHVVWLYLTTYFVLQFNNKI